MQKCKKRGSRPQLTPGFIELWTCGIVLGALCCHVLRHIASVVNLMRALYHKLGERTFFFVVWQIACLVQSGIVIVSPQLKAAFTQWIALRQRRRKMVMIPGTAIGQTSITRFP